MDIQTILTYAVLILIAIVVAFILYKVLKTAKNLIINIVLGFIIFFIGGFIVDNYLISYFPGAEPINYFSLVNLIITALTGVFGALVLLILSLFGITF
ncbi:transcriptional regulator [Methanolapillus millepedarum]|uniref:SigmaK-factor processing regulatory BofA n=1 Tax=Methanolapillus millepedarum TaxID=3028296 RepID=A0AA96ZVK3_9EURY|nr:hypothetical protein MsAc7_10880 [Methanosarcinaceae archaeon Ac7]